MTPNASIEDFIKEAFINTPLPHQSIKHTLEPLLRSKTVILRHHHPPVCAACCCLLPTAYDTVQSLTAHLHHNPGAHTPHTPQTSLLHTSHLTRSFTPLPLSYSLPLGGAASIAPRNELKPRRSRYLFKVLSSSSFYITPFRIHCGKKKTDGASPPIFSTSLKSPEDRSLLTDCCQCPITIT